MWIRSLILVTAVTSTAASILHALPAQDHQLHRKSTTILARGGSFEPTGQKLRQYAETDRMPSLFTQEEETYDRYAACLAATEGLRRLRDRDMTEEVEGIGDPEEVAKKRKQIAVQYVQNSGKVLRALGMSVGKFNELGKEISRDSKLKEKIIEQAYLYRMAAAIHLDQSPLPEKSEGSSPGSGDYLSSFQRDKVQLFCESMNEIERLRTGQVDRLKRALQVDDFPSNINISDPTLLPFLNPKVRAVVEAFPLQAERIVKRHGLESDEFNQMLHASKSNPIFRWKVQKHLKLNEPSQKKPVAQEQPADASPRLSGAAATPQRQAYSPQQQQQQRSDFPPQRSVPPQQRQPPPRQYASLERPAPANQF